MKKASRILVLVCVLLLVPAVVAGCGGGSASNAQAGGGAEGPDPLVMGVIPAEDNQEMVRLFEPVADHIGEELGTEVELYTATDYSGIIEAMRSGQVDLAWYGPLSYVLANKVAGAEAIAVQIAEEGETDPTYHSLMVTRKDSGIGDIRDLEGKTFSFVDPASTSGNLFPRKAFDEAGMDPEEDLAESTYAGGHDASVLAVENGTVDAGAVADTTYDLMVEEGMIEENDLRVIHESEPIPESPIAVREDLSPEVKKQLEDVLVEMTPEKVGSDTLGEDAVGYVEAEDSDYDVIRELVSQLGLDLQRLGSEA